MSSIVTALFGLTKHALGIWETKLARKYLDEVIYLEQKYYDEENKDENKRNHAFMDNIITRLCLIAQKTSEFKK